MIPVQQRKSSTRAKLWKEAEALVTECDCGCADALDKAVDAFEQAVRDEALEPREAAPELAEAERGFRSVATIPARSDYQVIAAELDRLRATVALEKRKVEALDRELVQPLRAELARLKDSQLTVYVGARDELDAFDQTRNGCSKNLPPDSHQGEGVYAVHLWAERVK